MERIAHSLWIKPSEYPHLLRPSSSSSHLNEVKQLLCLPCRGRPRSSPTVSSIQVLTRRINDWWDCPIASTRLKIPREIYHETAWQLHHQIIFYPCQVFIFSCSGSTSWLSSLSSLSSVFELLHRFLNSWKVWYVCLHMTSRAPLLLTILS